MTPGVQATWCRAVQALGQALGQGVQALGQGNARQGPGQRRIAPGHVHPRPPRPARRIVLACLDRPRRCACARLVGVLACLDSQASVRCDMRRPGAWSVLAWRDARPRPPCDSARQAPGPGAAGRCDARPGALRACDGRCGAAVRQAPRGRCDGRRAKPTPRLGAFGFWLTAAKAMSPRPPPIDLSPNQKKNTVGYALCRREWSSAPARRHVCGLGGDPHLVGGWGLSGVDCSQASCECEDDCEEVCGVGHAEA